MALTRDFKDTIKNRVARDPSFRKELLKEGIECLLTGDVDTGKAVLRDTTCDVMSLACCIIAS